MKLTIKRNDASLQGIEVVGRIMNYLRNTIDIIDDPDYIWFTVEDYLKYWQEIADDKVSYPQRLRDLTLIALGSDMPSLCQQVAQMRLISDQAGLNDEVCPVCGNSDFSENYTFCSKCHNKIQ